MKFDLVLWANSGDQIQNRTLHRTKRERIMLPKINLEHLELLRPWAGASDPAPWRPKVYMILTLTHSVTKMQLT